MAWKSVGVVRVYCRACRHTLETDNTLLASAIIVAVEHQVQQRHEQVAVTFTGLRDGVAAKHTMCASRPRR